MAVYNAHKKTANIQINRYDANGKQTLKYSDKVNLKSKYTDLIIDDVMIKGNKIYYCYHERNEPEILNVRYINKNIKKNQKAKESCTITLNNGFARARLENNCIYTLQSDQIGKYSLKGKQTVTYTLPEGEKQLFTEIPDYDSMNNEDTMLASMTIDNFCVNKNTVFYCNANGIYKLAKNKKPKLIYNAKNDNFFAGEYGVKDICTGDNNTFYLMFDNIRNYEVCIYDWAYKLVKYSK